MLEEKNELIFHYYMPIKNHQECVIFRKLANFINFMFQNIYVRKI